MKTDLDDLDYAILAHLQEDGRKPFTLISDDLGVSANTVKNRYSRLVDEGYLRVTGYVDPYRAGFLTHVFLSVKIEAGALDRVARRLVDLPESDYIAIVSGEYDIDVTLSCRDHEHLLDVIRRVHAIDGVIDTHTTMVLKMLKNRQASVALLRALAGEQRDDR